MGDEIPHPLIVLIVVGDITMKQKHKNFVRKYLYITVQEAALAGILIALYLISDKFISFNIKGIMHVGITFVFSIMFGLLFGPFKGMFVALIADTIKLLLITGIHKWMWEYEIISMGIPLMAWGFKYLFEAKEKHWWIIMIIINLISFVAVIAVVALSDNGGELRAKASKIGKRSFDFSNGTMIMIYIITSFFYVLELLFMIKYKQKKDENVKLMLSMGALVTMIVIVWIWVWGPVAYVRYLDRLYGHKHPGRYTYEAYYKIGLWARILKTPIIVPLYTIILVPLYKASGIAMNNMTNNSH